MQTFKPSEYLQIAIANAFGLDKLTWNDRITWFLLNQDNLDALQRDAEEPAMFFAAVQAWRDYLDGRPSGFPISLDATASGLQLLAIMTGDRKAAELCNVVDTGKREDAYTAIYEDMVEKIGGTGHIQRDDTKKAIMTSLYGSTEQPKRVFGEGHLLQIFEETMEERAPFVWYLNKAFLSMWNPTVSKYEWKMPDNFHVRTKVINTVEETVFFNNQNVNITYKVNEPTPQGRSLGANTTHSVDGMIVREMIRRCNYSIEQISYVQQCLDGLPVHQSSTPTRDYHKTRALWKNYQDSGFLSARILEFINPETVSIVDAGVIQKLIDSLPDKPFTVIAVHDCFRVLPSYGNDLRKQYNQILHDLSKSNILQYLLSQITGRPIKINKSDPTMHLDILNSNYALS